MTTTTAAATPHAPTTPDTDLADRVREATALLAQVAADRTVLDTVPAEDRARLHAVVAEVYHPDPRARRQRLKARERERNAENIRRSEALLESTGIRELRRKPVFTTPNYFPPTAAGQHLMLESQPAPQATAPDPSRESPELLHCYVCKQKYRQVHHFYDQLCPPCADFNFFKRTELADLTGRVALLTGGRVKIGYQAGMKLLRAGARLIVTTRFPRDSAMRYAQEPDFEDWAHRLEIFGLDLRHTPSVEAFCSEMLATHDRLDFIINNACQTVRRPPAFYAHMMAGETAALHEAPEHIRRLIGRYEGLRSYTMLPEGDGSQALQSAEAKALRDAAGITRAAGEAYQSVGR
jgi:hypothetical protein